MEVDSIAYQQTVKTMSGQQNTEDNATARAIAELEESMRLMREEMKVMKTSGVTRAGNDPLQQLGASENAMNPGSFGYCLGEAQRKCGHDTDYYDEDERKYQEEDDDDASEDEGETLFHVSEAENAFLEIVFIK